MNTANDFRTIRVIKLKKGLSKKYWAAPNYFVVSLIFSILGVRYDNKSKNTV